MGLSAGSSSAPQQRGHRGCASFSCCSYTYVSYKIPTSSLVFPPCGLGRGKSAVPGLSPSWPCPVAKSHLIPEAPQLEPVPSLPWGKPCSHAPLPRWGLLMPGLRLSQLSRLSLGASSAHAQCTALAAGASVLVGSCSWSLHCKGKNTMRHKVH